MNIINFDTIIDNGLYQHTFYAFGMLNTYDKNRSLEKSFRSQQIIKYNKIPQESRHMIDLLRQLSTDLKLCI